MKYATILKMNPFKKTISALGLVGAMCFSGCTEDNIPVNPPVYNPPARVSYQPAPVSQRSHSPINSLPAEQVPDTYNFNSDSLRYTNKYEEKLLTSPTLTIEEKLLSLGKFYHIYPGKNTKQKPIATVKGKNWNWLNDVFVLKTVDGKILASEKEVFKFFKFTRAANCFDGNGRNYGYIGEELNWKDALTFGHVFHIYDSNKFQIGRSVRGALTGDITIRNNAGNNDYFADKELLHIRDRFVLYVQNPNSRIPRVHAILLTCIEEALMDAEAARARESSSKSSVLGTSDRQAKEKMKKSMDKFKENMKKIEENMKNFMYRSFYFEDPNYINKR
jgi:hypothetical protein